MTFNPSYIADLLLKSHLGNLSEEEQQLLDHWLTADPSNPQLANMLLDKERLKKQYEEYRTIDSRGSWEAIRASLPDLGLPEYEDEPPPVVRRLGFLRYKAAVWLTLVVGSGLVVAGLIWRGGKKKNTVADAVAVSSTFGVLLQYNGAEPIDLSACRKGWRLEGGNLLLTEPDSGLVQLSVLDAKAPIGHVSITTPKGVSYRLRLPDSSTVRLNADSRFDIDRYNGSDRQVSLRGEAYFDIRHRDGYPFTLDAGQSVTFRVLGTIFNVKAYPHDSTIQTTLVSGKLIVCDPKGRPHLLVSGQTLVFDRNGQVRTPPASDTTGEIPWVKDTFNYNGTPIREILDDLSHWYRVDIEVQGEPIGHFTFSCSRRETLEFILGRLANTKHLHYQTFENKVIVYFDKP